MTFDTASFLHNHKLAFTLTTKLCSNHETSKMDIGNWIRKLRFFFCRRRARARVGPNGQINSIRVQATCLPGTRKLSGSFLTFFRTLFTRCRKGIVPLGQWAAILLLVSSDCTDCAFVCFRYVRVRFLKSDTLAVKLQRSRWICFGFVLALLWKVEGWVSMESFDVCWRKETRLQNRNAV